MYNFIGNQAPTNVDKLGIDVFSGKTEASEDQSLYAAKEDPKRKGVMWKTLNSLCNGYRR